MLSVKRRLLSLNFAILMLLSVILPAGAADITSQDQTETHQYEQYIVIDGTEYDATEDHSGDGWEYYYHKNNSSQQLDLTDYHGSSIISNVGLSIGFAGNNTITGTTYGIYTTSELFLGADEYRRKASRLYVVGANGYEAIYSEDIANIGGDLTAIGGGCAALHQNETLEIEPYWPSKMFVGSSSSDAVEGEYNGQQYISFERIPYQITLYSNESGNENAPVKRQITFDTGTPGYINLYTYFYEFYNDECPLVGWADKANNSGKYYCVDETYTFADNTYSADLYAIREDSTFKAIILDNYYGRYGKHNEKKHLGDMLPIPVEKGSQYKLPNQVKSGCKFDGWLAENGEIYPADTIITVDQSMTFSAQFTALTLKIDGNEFDASRKHFGTGWKYYASGTRNYNSTLFLESDYSGEPIELPVSAAIHLDTSLSNDFEIAPIIVHGDASIRVSQYDDSIISSIIVSGRNTPAVIVDGKLCVEIYDDGKLTMRSNNTAIPAIQAQSVYTDEKAFVVGTDENHKTFVSHYSGESYVEFTDANTFYIDVAGTVTLPTMPEHDLYTFIGWRNAAIDYGEDKKLQQWYMPGDKIDAGGGMKLEAEYIHNNRSSTAFIIDGQGGTTPKTSRYFVTFASTDHLQAYSWPDNPFVYTGKTFIGYNTASDGSGTMYQPGEKLEASNLVQKIYAQWKDESSGGGASGGSTSGGGGDGAAVSTSPNNEISASAASNGKVSLDKHTAKKDDTVTITVTPDAGYKLEQLTVTDAKGNTVAVSKMSDGKYTFIMPASGVEIKAEFTVKQDMLFADVKQVDYFYDAVQWAVENDITNGVSDTLFNSGADCTRAQAVTFLWRAAGAPEPVNADSFTDVLKDSYYAKAAAWAVENGIASGVSATEFAPDATCTRAQIVTFLWRAEKAPAVDAESAFTDVESDAYYADAVQWALKNGVTNGISASAFNPDASCTRAQIVTFLWRTLAE